MSRKFEFISLVLEAILPYRFHFASLFFWSGAKHQRATPQWRAILSRLVSVFVVLDPRLAMNPFAHDYAAISVSTFFAFVVFGF